MPFKKTFSIIFSVLMSMSCLSAPVWAEPADTVQETDQSPPEDGLFFEEDVETAVPDVEFENDEMLNAYLETILYSDVEDSDHVSFGLTYAQVDNVAENCLTGSALGFYRALKENSEKVASGEVTSTQFAINTASYGIKRDFTAAELGLQSISGITVAVKNAIKEKLAEELDFASVLTCLLNDNPYIMYWFDKTMGASYSYSAGVMQSDSGYYVSVPKITVKMYVAPGYYDVEDGTALVVDPYAVELATEASNNAKQIVTKHAGEGDYAKVCSYRDEIYALVAYDYDAANIGTFEDYGTSDPWQLIWVFDGDPDTNVVCEGYSKAMQYLCDLSSFESPNIECYSVTGELGGGGHMWNILVMDDGVPYLVDLTNSDEGTIGESDGVFLDGAVSGSVEDGFVMRNFGPSLMFVYDENTLATTAYDVLNISMTDYAPVSSIISNHVTFNSNGADSGSVDPIDLSADGSAVIPDNSFKKSGYIFSGWNTAADGSGTSYSAGATVEGLISTESEEVTLYAQWTKDTQYTITFNKNGADSGSVASLKAYAHEGFTFPANGFSKAHADFIGWNTKADGSGKVYQPGDKIDSVSANTTYYAQWQMKQSFTVTFEKNGADSGTVSKKTVYADETMTFPANGFTKAHASFIGWNTAADGSGTMYQPGDTMAGLSKNLNFYAQWQMEKTYIVTFDPNGAESGSMNSLTVYESDSVTLTKNGFKKAHATFGGWNTASDGSGTSYKDAEEIGTISSDVILYAMWNMDEQYRISFDPNQATGSMNDILVYTGDSFTVPACDFSKEHATFIGWNSKADGSGTSYKVGASVDNVSANMKLYAQWKMDQQFTITFDPNGAESGSINSISVYEGDSFNLPHNGFTKDHGTFAGWNTKADGSGANYTAGSTVESVSKNTVFYAQWVMDRKISVSFDGNGADEGSLVPVTVYINTSFEIPSHSFTKAHAVFTGWNTETDGSGTGYDDCGTFAGATQDTVLYAQWQMLDSHTATFDPNGAESGSVDAIVSYVDEELVLPKNGFSKEHATFLGWNTAADGTGTSYQPGESMGVISEDVNLYAQWQMSESYTVRFDWNSADSGSVGDMTVYADASLVFPENGFTKAHATFKGWSVSLDGSDTVYKPGDSVDGITSDLVFYAQWEMDPMYVVNFDWNYANSGSVSDLVVYGGDKFALPKNGFTKEHFTFDGWNTKVDGSGTPYGEGGIVDGVNKNTTFYAQWKAVAEYDIRFDWNYANSGSVNNMKAYADSSLVLPENGFTKNHSVFKGWNTSADGFGASYQPGDAVLSVTDDMVFYAQWEELPIYDIRFDWNYANSGSMSNARVYSDETFSTPENGFEKLHATFVCWNTAIDGSGVSYNPGDTIESISEDMTLYAMWQDVATVDVRFDWNYANSGSVGNMTVYADSSFVLPENGFAKDNATFVGWSTVADGTGTVYRPGDSVEPVTEDTVFFAQWKKNPQYTVRFDWNYANSGSVDSITVFEGNAVTVPENGFAKDGFTFSGWNTKADGSGTSFKAGEILESLERDVVLYAQWNELPSVTVTFDWNYADEGEMSSIVVRKGEMVVMPENGFVRNGYYFSGWNTKMDGSGVAIKDAAEIYLFEAVEGKDAVLYAQWESDCTEVTINHPAETKQVCA